MKNPIRVLYVDDDKGLLDIGKQFLERTGDFSVTTLESATLALELLKKDRFDAIISDYQMPGMDGIRFLEEVRTRFGKIPFIIFTGRGREEIVIQALNAGADFYLQKGGSLEAQFAELSHKVQTAVENFRSREKIQSLNRLYSVLSATNKAIVFLRERDEFFSEICRILVEIGGFRMAWIGLADTGHHLIRPVAAAGHINGYLDNIRISTEDVPRGRGPTGRAYREGTYYFSNDIAHDPLMEPWRENALKQGYLANAAFPFSLGTKNAGVISVYAPVTGFFDDRVIDLLEELSADVSFALRTLDDQNAQKTAETALYNSENRYRSLVDGLHDCVVVYAAVDEGEDFVILEFNQSAERTEQVSREEVVGHRLTEIFPGVLEFGLFEVFRRVMDTGIPESFPVAFYTDNRISGWRDNFVYRLPSGEIVASYCDETARKKAEEALKESELRFRSLIQNSSDLINILDTEGRIIFDSPSTQRILGYPEGFFIGRQALDFIHPDDLEVVRGSIKEVLRHANPGTPTEFRLRRADGDYIDVEAVAVNLIGVAGVNGIVVTTHPITERKRDERALRQSEEKYRDLYDNAPNAYYSIGTDGCIIRCNKEAGRILGIPHEDLVGKKISEFYADTPDGREKAVRLIGGFRNGKTLSNEELRMKRADGTLIWIQLTVNAVRDSSGQIIESRTTIVDITERKRAEDALRTNEHRLASIYDTVSDVIFHLSIEPGGVFRFSSVNPAFSQVTGLPAHAVVGKRVDEIIPEPSLAMVLAKYRQAIKEKTIIRWEETTDYPSGRLSGEVSVAPVCDDAGICTHLVGSVHDITDRKRAEDAIRQANRQLNLMTSITRHDINNKISIITGYLAVAKKKFTDPVLEDYFGKMQSAIKAIQAQIEFTRVYQDLGTREPQWEELGKVLSKSHVPPKVFLNAEVTGIEVYADPMLEKVFFNLLDNSIRHGQHVTEIRVSACRSPEGLTIFWEDNGIGIVPEEKEKIFERGFGRNTGLGMFLAREILSLTGISIRETGTEGMGARFEIIVPPGKFRPA